MNSTNDLSTNFLDNYPLPFDFENINIKNLENIIYLTEKGFSEPIGSYNHKTHIATLNKSVSNKTLVILISDFTLIGNDNSIANNELDISLFISKGLKNINIENLKFNSHHINVFIEPLCENINFSNCVFECQNIGVGSIASKKISISHCNFPFANTGILLFGCKDALIKSSQFISNESGIYLYENNNNCTIKDNLFLDCIEGISIESKNNFNIISNNKFENENNTLQQYCISVLTSNNYNKISKNLMVFSNKSINYDVGSINSRFIGIYLEEDINSFNTISNNKITFKNNTFNFNNTNPNIFIAGIACYECNNDIDISENEIEIINNEFTMKKGNAQSVILNNIYVSNHNNGIIKNNICSISKNITNLSLKEGLFEINNLIFDNENKSIKVFYNKFDILDNKSINKNSIFRSFNISLIDSNSDLNIKDNLFKLKNNSQGLLSSVNICSENYGNKVSYNKFIDINGISILLDYYNIGNVIMYNTINCDNFTIILNDSNDSNIIKENSLYTIASSNLLLVTNNVNNLISSNNIENKFLGIVLINNSNNFNSIELNEFYETSEDIATHKESYNYIYNNSKYTTEDYNNND